MLNSYEAVRLKGQRQFVKAVDLFVEVAAAGYSIDKAVAQIVQIASVLEQNNDNNAWQCYLKAAELGNGESQWKVAEHTWSEPSCRQKAVEWAIKAADNGIVQAQKFMGDRYLEGDMLEQNDDLAEAWYLKAAHQGDEEAMQLLEEYYCEEARGMKNEVRRILRNAKKGEVDAQYQMAQFYLNGTDVKEDKEKAFNWFTHAADQNHIESQYQLSRCYQFGWGTEKNENQAVTWLAESAKGGHEETQYEMGKRCFEGYGVPKDLDKAEKWLTIPISSGNSKAIELLKKIQQSRIVSIKDTINSALIKIDPDYNIVKRRLHIPKNNELIRHKLHIPKHQEIFLAIEDDHSLAFTGEGIYTYWSVYFISWIEVKNGELLFDNDRYYGSTSLYLGDHSSLFYMGKIGKYIYDICKEIQNLLKNKWGQIREIPSNISNMSECVAVSLEKADLNSKNKYFSGVEKSWGNSDALTSKTIIKSSPFQIGVGPNKPKMNYADFDIPRDSTVYLAHNCMVMPGHPMGFALTSSGIFHRILFTENVGWRAFIEGKLKADSDYRNVKLIADEDTKYISTVDFDTKTDQEHFFVFLKTLQQLLIANWDRIDPAIIRTSN